MIVVYGCTSDWGDYLITSIKSLISNNEVEKIIVFVEDYMDLSVFRDVYIEQILYKPVLDEYICNLNRKTRFSEAALIRLILPKVVKDRKVLWLDTDTIVDGTIDYLWNVDLSNSYIGGISDRGMFESYTGYAKNGEVLQDYVNSGVLLMNLDLIRRNSIDDYMLDLINTYDYLYPDQDVLNVCCREGLVILDPVYNDFTHKCQKSVIYHWAGFDKSDWVYDLPNGDKWSKYEEMIKNGR